MIAVIFEVIPEPGCRDAYLEGGERLTVTESWPTVLRSHS